MKKTLNFINLSIDQNWDECQFLSQVFPIRIPNSENLQLSLLDLSIFLAKEGDTCVVHNSFDPDFRKFLTKRGLCNIHLLEIKENPYYEDKWMLEFERKVNKQKFESFNFCAISSIENLIVQTTKEKNSDSVLISKQKYSVWNNKTFLLKLAQELHFEIPETHIVELGSLKEHLISVQVDFPIFIKYVHSSGGGGCFVVESKTDLKFIDYLQRFRDMFPKAQWLIQEKVNVKREYSIVGYSNEETAPQLFEVCYDKNGYSYLHKWSDLDNNSVDSEKILSIEKTLAQWLRDNNYYGPFGFDSIVTQENRYPIIDLNIRYNKGHMIILAARKLGLKNVDSYRFRWRGYAQDHFSIWWEKIRKILDLSDIGENNDGHVFIPYIFSGMKNKNNLLESEKKVLDLSYFINSVDDSNTSSNMSIETWKNRIEQAILTTTQGEIL